MIVNILWKNIQNFFGVKNIFYQKISLNFFSPIFSFKITTYITLASLYIQVF
jgi:hypothetical protein